MEVKGKTMPDGKSVLEFIVTGHSTGLVGRLYPVTDTALSVFDPLIMQSLSYSLKEKYGKKERRRVVVFDHARRTVISTLNNDPPATLDVPEQVQDGCRRSITFGRGTTSRPARPSSSTCSTAKRTGPSNSRCLGKERLKTQRR